MSFLSENAKIQIPMVAKAAFGVYLGWICIAMIANNMKVLVFYGWKCLWIKRSFLTCLMVIIGAIIVSWTFNKFNNIFIGAMVLWAFSGIVIKRIEPSNIIDSLSGLRFSLSLLF
ncbi:MAG: hypothetical protein U5M51_09395 [Emticicia sp.]|nr:hypothetical protein [Emticicia sp.]